MKSLFHFAYFPIAPPNHAHNPFHALATHLGVVACYRIDVAQSIFADVDFRGVLAMKLSRTKIELFQNCPRCFWLEVKAGVKRPPGFPLSLNNAVDHLFKCEFDAYRGGTVVPPRLQKAGLAYIPAAHPSFKVWRQNFKGVSTNHAATGLELYGAIDDLWVDKEGMHYVADYKATSKAADVSLDDDWQIGYKRQVEFYQWLLRQNGLRVSNRAWFVYANGIKDDSAFNDVLHFRTKLIPYDGSDAWVEPTLLAVKDCLGRTQAPVAANDCKHCAYVKAASASVAIPVTGTRNPDPDGESPA